MATPSPRPPLPFGLGREPSCDPNRCLDPGLKLPQPGTPLHDQVAQALSALFSTFYATSLRYLGVSEILDWIEANGTVDAWILTGLEQQRSPAEVGSPANLEVGKGAIRSVIKAALAQDDEAWATSLREVGFSSGLSMAYEGIVSQLKPTKSSPLPCLYSLLTPAGLAMLKSAPLKHSFPICPPRTPPSPATLLASIRSLLASGNSNLTGPTWKQPSVWRPQVRKAFAKYHLMVKEVAEEVVCEPGFSKEYTIFLESISQPIQLLHLISEDFELEFGPGACKGLLGVGEVGGQNLCAIMDFCAAKRPSELLARVKQRVAEKSAREKLQSAIDGKAARLSEIHAEQGAILTQAEALRQNGRMVTHADALLDAQLKARHDVLKLEFDTLVAQKGKLMKERERGLVQQEAVRAKQQELAKAAEGMKIAAEGIKAAGGASGVMQGSSKDLLRAEKAADPFSATAPRAVSPSVQSNKGKGRALSANTGASRQPNRYPNRTNLPPPPGPPNRSLSPAPSSRSASPAPRPRTRAAPPAMASAPHTPPASPPRRPAKLAPSQLSRNPSPARAAGPSSPDEGACACDCDACRSEQRNRDHDHNADGSCCSACAAEMLQSTMGAILGRGATLGAAPQVDFAQLNLGEGPQALPVLPQPLPLPQAAAVVEQDERSAPLPPPQSVEHAVDGANAATTPSKKKKKKKSKAKTRSPAEAPIDPVASATLTAPPPEPKVVLSLTRAPPPFSCPPDRCTGDQPNYDVWPELDRLLFETILAGLKYELIDAFASPLETIRDRVAKVYIRSGGLMMNGDRPRDMNDYIHEAEAIGMWAAVSPEVQAFTVRTLATSLQKLLEVFRAQIGDVCICRMSRNLDVLRHARDRLTQCEEADRKVPITLAEMDQQAFMKWAHAELHAGTIGGPEWQGRERANRLYDFLLSFSDAFDAAIDRLVDGPAPYQVADDLVALLKYVGGVRAVDVALRLGTGNLYATLDASGGGPKEDRPLQSWGKFLEISAELRASGGCMEEGVADEEKRRGNEHFARGEYQKAVVAFGTAGVIAPARDPAFWTNAAAARLKLATPLQYAEAVSDCTFALEIDPGCVKALYRRGIALQALGRWAEAVEDLEELVRVSPENQAGREALAWVRKARR